MGLKVVGVEEIAKELQELVEKQRKEVIIRLSRIGQMVVNDIRDSKISNWMDQSGNLRSSIGYMVTVDGQRVDTGGFQVVKEGVQGVINGKSYIDSLVSTVPKGIALIIVAGMDYASYVEKIKNKSVLAQARIVADGLVREMVEKLNKKK